MRDMERFLLELGAGFTFVARQKRVSVVPDDFYFDLLFYRRHLRRLVAVELMNLNSANIRVAEYLAHIPDMNLLQQQLHRVAELARERAAQRTLQHLRESEGENE